MKDIRILGVDDSHFKPHTSGKVKIIGVVMRKSLYIDGFLMREVEIDGWDATDKILDMLNSKYGRDIRVVMTQGITFGGFNIFDPVKFWENSGIPVIVISRRMPDLERIRNALSKHFPDWEKRFEVISSLRIKSIENSGGVVHFQHVGIDEEDAVHLIRETTIRGSIPEAVRIAHLVASAINFGESRGKP